ncbi:NYN domain-containing protein [Gaopeijia maritima]|uniref:NYN domain-containing protein n=1 Tax=Gaopeijia maritima TaxID=3119007 RepID=UPI00326C153B
MPFTRAPHRGDAVAPAAAPNAALLIDFDNVTMGMRSDLSRDLRKLLESDIIKGKVTVQRAYADWRRYPQYIVPLSENSIDLIFAPAYGSSKKNATDIRMAIDAMELVFVRPEIGTFILLTGDSDFSSCVLKLKEYGKYVIGVGIQESSSDILVQNCDEYYSYTSLTGLTKTTGGDQKSADPWVLVEQAIKKMVERDDVMRSDRLKQVMIEIDSTFDEGSFGFSKFSRFLTEAASKNLVELRKMENGQYEVGPPSGKGSSSGGHSRRDDRRDDRRSRGRDRSNGRGRRGRGAGDDEKERTSSAESAPETSSEGPSRNDAYALLTQALEALRNDGRHPVRDSDVKRRMLEIDGNFDEGELGFPKFSRFLQQADDDGIVSLRKEDGGNYEVALGDAAPAADAADEAQESAAEGADDAAVEEPTSGEDAAVDAAPEPDASAGSGPVVRELRPEDVIDPDAPGRRLGPRGGTTRRRDDDAPPPLLPGQAGGAVQSTDDTGGAEAAASDEEPVEAEKPKRRSRRGGSKRGGAKKADEAKAEKPAEESPKAETSQDDRPADDGADASEVNVESLGLPTDADAQLRYLSNSYRGVGKKTAEALVENFGETLFTVLQTDPERVKSVVPPARAEAVLEAWAEDFARRSSEAAESESESEGGRSSGGRGRGRRGRRGRGGRSS